MNSLEKIILVLFLVIITSIFYRGVEKDARVEQEAGIIKLKMAQVNLSIAQVAVRAGKYRHQHIKVTDLMSVSRPRLGYKWSNKTAQWEQE